MVQSRERRAPATPLRLETALEKQLALRKILTRFGIQNKIETSSSMYKTERKDIDLDRFECLQQKEVFSEYTQKYDHSRLLDLYKDGGTAKEKMVI